MPNRNYSVDEALEIMARTIDRVFHCRAEFGYFDLVTREGTRLKKKLCFRMLELTGAPVTISEADAETTQIHAENVNEPDGKQSQCISDIIDVLQKAKHPMTTTLILAALSKAGKDWSQSYVAKFLSDMVKDGTLANPPGAKPPGYRLSHWQTTSGVEEN